MSGGLSDPEIAVRMQIDTDTARKHVLHIRAKLGVDSKLKAVLFALRHGAIHDAGTGVQVEGTENEDRISGDTMSAGVRTAAHSQPY